jgi:uncharacterized SAM-binding protein YcdF (DUF218 family)
VRRGEHGGIFFRLLFLLLCLGFFAVLYAARRPLLRFAGEFWVIDEPAAPSDALIVLGDDNYAADRAFHAAGLYRSGVAPVVVASGRMLRQNVSLADVMEHDLQSYGVPAPSIVKLSNRAENTREEAVEAARLIQARGWKRIIVVTSNYHARRARFIYGKILPSSVSFRVCGARDSDFDPSRWWETRLGQKLFLFELGGYLVARWELRNGPSTGNEAVLMNSRAPADIHAQGVSRQVTSASRVQYQIGNTRSPWGSPRWFSAYYSSEVTVLSGLLRTLPSLAVTEFSVGGKHVA